MKTHPSEKTLGRYWIDRAGVIWEQISYTPMPTASFRRVIDPSQRLSGVVNSRLLSELELLIPEDEIAFRESVGDKPEHPPENPSNHGG